MGAVVLDHQLIEQNANLLRRSLPRWPLVHPGPHGRAAHSEQAGRAPFCDLEEHPRRDVLIDESPFAEGYLQRISCNNCKASVRPRFCR
jgi:hypothetical protein